MQPSSKWIQGAVLVFALSATLLAQSSAPTKPKTRKPAPKPNPTVQEIEELKALIQAQQQQITQQGQQVDQLRTQLQQVLDSSQQANAAAQKTQSNVDQVQAAASQAQQSAVQAQQLATQAQASAAEATSGLAVVTTKTGEEDKQLSALQALIGRFRFSGDLRVRGEGFYQPGTITRNRARIRARFGVEGELNQDFTAGIFLASGTLADPTTTNETLTAGFDRKTIALDRGYITYNPVAARWMSLTAGKFTFPWYRTSLTFDPDVNPEGFDEKFSFDLHTPGLKNFTVQAFQLLYNEASKGDDSFALGGQVSAVLQAGPWTATPSFSLIDFRFPDALLAASGFQAGTSPGEGPGCSAGFGLTPTSTPVVCAFAANGMTNATFLDAGGVAHFLSGFEYADFILNNQVQTGIKKLPFNLIGEYEDNLKAADHPLNATGGVIADLGAQGRAYMVDASFGQTKNKNDFQFGYSYWRTEQDAIISSWAESDERAPTNVIQNRIYGLWKVRKNVVAQYSLWVGHSLNSNLEHAALATGVKPGQDDPYLKRQQFDIIYSF
jgi:hypothetical protein